MTDTRGKISNRLPSSNEKKTVIKGAFSGMLPFSDVEMNRIRDYLEENCEKYLGDTIVEKSGHIVLILRDRCYFILACKTGFRVSELLSLRISHFIDPANGSYRKFITLEAFNMKGRKSGRQVQVAPIVQRVIKDLLRYWEMIYGKQWEFSDFLFCARHYDAKGRPINKRMNRSSANVIIDRLLSHSGVDLEKHGNHSMRKFFCKQLYEMSGKDIVLTCRHMGHSDPKTTLAYLSANNDSVKAFYDEA